MPRRQLGLAQAQVREQNAAIARDYIARVGIEQARRDSDTEITRSVFDVTYPFGRVALYRAIRDELDAR